MLSPHTLTSPVTGRTFLASDSTRYWITVCVVCCVRVNSITLHHGVRKKDCTSPFYNVTFYAIDRRRVIFNRRSSWYYVCRCVYEHRESSVLSLCERACVYWTETKETLNKRLWKEILFEFSFSLMLQIWTEVKQAL